MLSVYADLYIEGGGSQDPDLLIAATEKNAPSDWKRELDVESRIRSGASAEDRPTYVFEKSYSGGGKALVFLLRMTDHFKVTNIVPKGRPRLEHSEYNSILREFAEKVIGPAAKLLAYTCRLTDESLAISHWIGPDAEQKLRAFSSSANKGTGSAHPSDFKRWSAFIIACNSERSTLTAATLERWLVEEESWPSEVASTLSGEYEFGRQLLKIYESAR